MPGVMLLFIAIGLPLATLSGIKPDYFFFPIAGSWVLAFLIVGWRLNWFRCPRCRNRFFSTWWYHNPFARKCVHCGLPKWANSDLTLRTPPQSN
jgi:hypothetical protein